MAFIYPLIRNIPSWLSFILVIAFLGMTYLVLKSVVYFDSNKPLKAAICLGVVFAFAIVLFVLVKKYTNS